MSITHVLLSLLARQPMHGYELKSAFDEQFGSIWNLNFGQVYPALEKLKDHRWIRVSETVHGRDKKVYAITDEGLAELDRWLTGPPDPPRMTREDIFMRLAVAASRGRETLTKVIHQQRRVHQTALAEFVRIRSSLDARRDAYARLICDAAILKIEAELKWLDLAEEQIPLLLDSARGEKG